MLSNKFSLQPPCPMCGAQPATDRRIIIILIIALIIIIGLYISDYRIKPWNITCSSPSVSITTGPMVKNNIQASHTYNIMPYMIPSNKSNNMYCFSGVDDFGGLWGSSMQPTFFEGNTVLLKNYTTTTKLRTGDIIRYFRYDKIHPNCTSIHDAIANNSLGGAYINNSMAVIHRINSIYNDDIVVQGDNLNEIETINSCQITDIVVGIIFT